VHALESVDLQPGDTVTIVGGGSLGAMLTALAADVDAHVVVLDPHDSHLERAPAFGAAETIRATRSSADVEALRRLTGGRGAELVIEAVGRPETWELAVEMAAPGGTVSFFGGCARRTQFTARRSASTTTRCG
jgi:L-iditol 2-dehydrogenase